MYLSYLLERVPGKMFAIKRHFYKSKYIIILSNCFSRHLSKHNFAITYFVGENSAKRVQTGPNEVKRGQIGPNKFKLGQTSSNWANQSLTGQNRPNRA